MQYKYNNQNVKKEISKILERFLIRELGDQYIDVIEMEWNMTLKEFIDTYLIVVNGKWKSII